MVLGSHNKNRTIRFTHKTPAGKPIMPLAACDSLMGGCGIVLEGHGAFGILSQSVWDWV